MLKNELLDDDAAEVLEEKFLATDEGEETVDAIEGKENSNENDNEESAM